MAEIPQNGATEMYNLRWNSYHSNLTSIFTELQSQESLVDVTLSCEGQFIKAHRLVLSACSSYFQKMFEMHQSTSHLMIVLNDVKYNDLKMIVHFMYNGEVKVADDDIYNFLSLGKTLQIKGLCSVQLKDQALGTEADKVPTSKKRRLSTKINHSPSIVKKSSEETKSRRPPNAFMLFANQWRKKLSVEYPEDTPKDISLKLSNMWKALSQDTKISFYEEARQLEQEYKLKFSNYSFSPQRKTESDDSIVHSPGIDALMEVQLLENSSDVQV